MGYHSELVECQICTHEWVAVWPEEADKLECPNCGYLSEPIIKTPES